MPEHIPLKERYINPFTDFGFKRLFGQEANKDLLIDFLNELIKGKNHIRNLSYKSGEKFAQTEFDRKAVYDLYCENDQGEKFIIELQKAKQNFFKDRTVYYSTFPIQEQAEKGEWNYRLNAVYTVGILDFTFDDEYQKETVVTEVKLMDTEKHQVFYDKLTYIYLQMPNFKKEECELTTHFERWLYVLKNLSKLMERPAKLQEKIFSKLFEVAEISNLSRREYMDYEESLKHYRDMKNVIDTAKEEARAEGIQEGIEIGKTEGIEIGAHQALKRIVSEMVAEGESMEKIHRFTGFSIEEIERIRHANNS